MTKDAPSLQKLPDEPGVYFFLGERKEVLYVGKATSLKDRVRSYFSSDLGLTRGSHMVRMVERAKRVDFRTTDSVLEALILEAKLIKEFKPKYNTRDKDDKSWNYLVITTNEAYPRLLTVRGKELSAKLTGLCGDSSTGGDRRRQLAASSTGRDGRLQTADSSTGRDGRLQTAACSTRRDCSLQPADGSTGREGSLQPADSSMDGIASSPTPYSLHPTTSSTPSPLPVYGPFVHGGQFKEALKIIRKIFPYYDCEHPVLTLRAANDRKLRFNEVIGVYPREGTTEAIYRRTVRHIRDFFEGKKRKLIRSLEREMHTAARAQRFEDAQEIKRQLFALRHIEDVSLIRRERRVPEGGRAAERIEAYDVAHLGGSAMVGVMTVIVDGEPDKREYRTFSIRTVEKSNDVAALREVLERRLGHPEWRYPTLVVVDGGKAQLAAARDVLARAGVEIPVVAVTKDEHHRPKTVIGAIRERRAYAADILLANAEAHRFSLARHRRKRSIENEKVKAKK